MASRSRPASNVLPTYTHPHVLVIDEVGDLSYGPDGANVLFQVVNDRHLHSPTVTFLLSICRTEVASFLSTMALASTQVALSRGWITTGSWQRLPMPSRIPSTVKETHGLTDCRTSCYLGAPPTDAET